MSAFIVTAADRPGAAADLFEAVAGAGANITAIAAVTGGGIGAIAFTTDDDDATRHALDASGANYREAQVATARLDHRPGTLAAASRALADAGINIEAVFPSGMADDTVQVGFAVANAAAAEAAWG